AAADPEAATRALETIAETSRAALADMRRILGVLRDENGETADLIPQPADADIDALIGQVKTAGLNVSHVTLGAPRALPPGGDDGRARPARRRRRPGRRREARRGRARARGHARTRRDARRTPRRRPQTRGRVPRPVPHPAAQ